MRYWSDVYSEEDWAALRDRGGSFGQYSERARRTVEQLGPGDVLICYVTKARCFAGLLEPVGPVTTTSHPRHPVRLATRALVLLDPKDGVPWEEERIPSAWLLFSPREFPDQAFADRLATAIRAAAASPAR